MMKTGDENADMTFLLSHDNNYVTIVLPIDFIKLSFVMCPNINFTVDI